MTSKQREPVGRVMQPSQCKTREEWEACWEQKHRDYRDHMMDGRRSMLELDATTGETVLIAEPRWGS